MKIPTLDDYHAYDGAHCASLWNSLAESWRCSGCDRSKFELLRWRTRNYRPGMASTPPYKGWLAVVHRHHDHAAPFLSGQGRFPDTVICGQCNRAEGEAKRRLDLPKDFSFAPSEIHRFVFAAPHAAHRIDFYEALMVFESLDLASGRGVTASETSSSP